MTQALLATVHWRQVSPTVVCSREDRVKSKLFYDGLINSCMFSNKNLDRRRESSRYAARDRRGKEADIFEDLKTVVPLVEESTVTHVDRIALLRVASTMCRMRRNGAKCKCFFKTVNVASYKHLLVTLPSIAF